MAKKTAAKAAQKTILHISDCRVVPAQIGNVIAPTLVFEGHAPADGDTITATLANGVTYAGTVASTQENNGKVTVTFKDGLTPKK